MACVAMELVLSLTIFILDAVLGLLGVASLDPLVHRSALQSLFGNRVVARGPIHNPGSLCQMLWLHSWNLLVTLNLLLLGVFIFTSHWSLIRINIVHLAVLFNLRQYSKTSLRWNQARYNFLSHIFGGCSQEILQLN